MSIKELLAEERKHRNAGKWWVFLGVVIADNGKPVQVQIKSYGFYNQILQFDTDPVNYCSGHTVNKATAMHTHLRTQINKAADRRES